MDIIAMAPERPQTDGERFPGDVIPYWEDVIRPLECLHIDGGAPVVVGTTRDPLEEILEDDRPADEPDYEFVEPVSAAPSVTFRGEPLTLELVKQLEDTQWELPAAANDAHQPAGPDSEEIFAPVFHETPQYHRVLDKTRKRRAALYPKGHDARQRDDNHKAPGAQRRRSTIRTIKQLGAPPQAIASQHSLRELMAMMPDYFPQYYPFGA